MKTILYLGLEIPQQWSSTYRVIHYPIIQIVPRPINDELRCTCARATEVSHVLFTSKTAVRLAFQLFSDLNIRPSSMQDKHMVAVGQATAAALQAFHLEAAIPPQETAEGIVAWIEKHVHTPNASFFWPRASGARPVIRDYLHQKGYGLLECVLYDTVMTKEAPPSLDGVDQIFFSSPSTVDAFVNIYGNLPRDKGLMAQGPITLAKLHMIDPACHVEIRHASLS